jgi:carbon monoxide dehydrogenase subunit G
MPGATLDRVVDDDTFKATMQVKFGPISLSFGADIVRRRDEDARRVVLEVKARELKGRGRSDATIESSIEPAGDGTRVTSVTDLTLQGAVAQYGRGVIPDVSNRLVGEFADGVARELA